MIYQYEIQRYIIFCNKTNSWHFIRPSRPQTGAGR